MTGYVSGASQPLGRLFKIAVSMGIESAVKLHIARGDDLERRDQQGLTPLMIAASRDRANICKLLFNAGADVLAVDLAGRDALTIARECKAWDAAEVISQYVDKAVEEQHSFNTSTVVCDIEPLATVPSDLPICTDSNVPLEPDADISYASHDVGENASVCFSSDEVPPMVISPVTKLEESPLLLEGTKDERPEVLLPFWDETQHKAALSSSFGIGLDETVSSGIQVLTPCSEFPTIEGNSSREANAIEPIIEDQQFITFPENSPLPISVPVQESNITSKTLNSGLSSIVELTFGDWEAEEVIEPPCDDPRFAYIEKERQLSIDSHKPVEDRVFWDELDVFLPQQAVPLLRDENQEFRTSLRKLFLRAIREGSIPRLAIDRILAEQGDEYDVRVEVGIEWTLGAMGADIDSRLEFLSRICEKNFEVFIDPVETEDEEAQLDEALLYFDGWIAERNDSLRLYQRVASKIPLLSAEQEIDLAKKMEDAVVYALDSLAMWPQGLRSLLDEVESAGSSGLAYIVDTVNNIGDDTEAVDDAEEVNAPPEVNLNSEENKLFSESMDEDQLSIIEDPVEIFSRIRLLVEKPINDSTVTMIRADLDRLSFKRSFLIKMEQLAQHNKHPAALTYRQSITNLVSARNNMVQANLRLVMKLAWSHVRYGLPIEDLIQEGNIGLIQAADKFDWRRGYRFTTMATWWIKQRIGRGIADTAFDIRLPAHMYEKMSRVRSVIESLERLSGKTLSISEKAEISEFSLAKFELGARALSEPLSIEEAEQDSSFNSVESQTPFTLLALLQEEKIVKEMLAQLKPREALVLRLRFGIDVYDSYTLEQIGEKLEVTRERIRQIEAKALRILRSTSRLELASKILGRTFSRPTAITEKNKTEQRNALVAEIASDLLYVSVSNEHDNVSPAALNTVDISTASTVADFESTDVHWQLEFANAMSNTTSAQKEEGQVSRKLENQD
ncbi:sigma-70 family RNA polymerase sigma factor [Advenella sp. RU8]|uniref:sigma-70 family RNA polymerase sigma factor n=1 Tax=Advenella sp. RU8 TaxID=3399575 RepID=UPI003AAB0A88